MDMYCPSVRQIKNNFKSRKRSYKKGRLPVEILEDNGGRSERLGAGTYGAVYAVGEDTVVKEMDISRIPLPITTDIVRELGALRTLYDADNIIDLQHVEAGDYGNKYYAYLPRLRRTLVPYVHGDVSLSPNARRRLLFQLFSGLNQMFNRNIMHRDLKPHNIGINADGDLVIFDMGMSFFSMEGQVKDYKGDVVNIKERIEGKIQTSPWRSPEIFRGDITYNHKVDIWSAGIIMLELFRGRGYLLDPRYLFDEEQGRRFYRLYGSENLIYYLILYYFGQRNYIPLDVLLELPRKRRLTELSPQLERERDALDLLQRILVVDPEERLDIGGILNHPYFHGWGGETLSYFSKIVNMDSYYLPLADQDVDERGRENMISFMEKVYPEGEVLLHSILILDHVLRYNPRYSREISYLQKVIAYACLEISFHVNITAGRGDEPLSIYNLVQEDIGRGDLQFTITRVLQAISYDCYMITEYHYAVYYLNYYRRMEHINRCINTTINCLINPRTRDYTKCDLVKEVIAQLLEKYEPETGLVEELSTGDEGLSNIVRDNLL